DLGFTPRLVDCLEDVVLLRDEKLHVEALQSLGVGFPGGENRVEQLGLVGGVDRRRGQVVFYRRRLILLPCPGVGRRLLSERRGEASEQYRSKHELTHRASPPHCRSTRTLPEQ